MKNQALFSLKDKSQKLKCHLLQFLFGTLRVKVPNICYPSVIRYWDTYKSLLFHLEE